MAPSFNDIRSAVTDALAAEDKDKGEDLLVVDLGTDWVVYRDPDTVGGGYFRRSYKMDGDKAVLTSKPEKVIKAWESAADEKAETPTADQPKNLRDAGQKARDMFAKSRQEQAKETPGKSPQPA